MSEKYVIFGATGSIGSSLAEQLKNSGNNIHLVGRNESELSSISEKLGCSHTVADVLEDGFIEKVKSDISESLVHLPFLMVSNQLNLHNTLGL